MDTIVTCSSGSAADASRCGGTLPDQPDCAINYHFGMLLGVDDFRAEQGFHVGHARRHQRLLHGFGVVYGYGVSFVSKQQELQVEPGFAVDRHGRDLALDVAQCLGLPAWWEQQRDSDLFADIANKDDATFDADVLLCYGTCLSRPVPAIADPCAEQAIDIAYSRICEQARPTLVRRPKGAAPAMPPPYRLLRRLAGLLPPDAGDPDEAWLAGQIAALSGLTGSALRDAKAALWRAAAARSATATTDPEDPPLWLPPPDPDMIEDRSDCLVIARLTDLHLAHSATGWTVTIGSLSIDGRETLPPARLLLDLLEAGVEPAPPAAGPLIVADSGKLAGLDLSFSFDKPLAPASVTKTAFQVHEFIAASGWSPFTVQTAVLSNQNQTVTLNLDRAPAGVRVRAVAMGHSPTPVLGADFIPIGAPSANSDGVDLALTLPRS